MNKHTELDFFFSRSFSDTSDTLWWHLFHAFWDTLYPNKDSATGERITFESESWKTPRENQKWFGSVTWLVQKGSCVLINLENMTGKATLSSTRLHKQLVRAKQKKSWWSRSITSRFFTLYFSLALAWLKITLLTLCWRLRWKTLSMETLSGYIDDLIVSQHEIIMAQSELRGSVIVVIQPVPTHFYQSKEQSRACLSC